MIWYCLILSPHYYVVRVMLCSNQAVLVTAELLYPQMINLIHVYNVYTINMHHLYSVLHWQVIKHLAHMPASHNKLTWKWGSFSMRTSSLAAWLLWAIGLSSLRMSWTSSTLFSLTASSLGSSNCSWACNSITEQNPAEQPKSICFEIWSQ